MAPIKRGTARRLGLRLPPPSVPFSWDQFGVTMAEFEARMRVSRDLWTWYRPRVGGSREVTP